MAEPDYAKTRRWLLGPAEAQVTASGSRATFVSDMYFEAAEAIETLMKQQADHQAKVREYMDICENLSAQRAELYHTLVIAQTALKSYEYGNGSPELAKEICAAIEPVIERAKSSR
jgi:hypothetical protein